MQKLLQNLKEKKEVDRRNKEMEEVKVKFKVFFKNPRTHRLHDHRIRMEMSDTLDDVLDLAHSILKVDQFAPVERCRLVAFDNGNGHVVRSFEGEERLPLSKSTMSMRPMELLIEMRDDGDFERIAAGSVLTKVFTVDIESSDIDGPTDIRADADGTIGELKHVVGQRLGIAANRMVVALLKYKGMASALHCDKELVSLEQKSKIFVCPLDERDDEQSVGQRLTKIVERFEEIITLYFALPNTDKGNLRLHICQRIYSTNQKYFCICRCLRENVDPFV